MRALTIAAVLCVLGGCASEEPRPAHGSHAGGLYDLPEMRAGSEHRERGSRALEAAYATRDPYFKENGFGTAMSEFRKAEDAYAAALVVAQPRFRPVIETEIDQVAQWMRQIQRDRNTTKP